MTIVTNAAFFNAKPAKARHWVSPPGPCRGDAKGARVHPLRHLPFEERS